MSTTASGLCIRRRSRSRFALSAPQHRYPHRHAEISAAALPVQCLIDLTAAGVRAPCRRAHLGSRDPEPKTRPQCPLPPPLLAAVAAVAAVEVDAAPEAPRIAAVAWERAPRRMRSMRYSSTTSCIATSAHTRAHRAVSDDRRL
jgi:hypothetical protein